MSSTPVDFAKVTQMLDAGWVVQVEKGGMSGYIARGRHNNWAVWERAKSRMRRAIIDAGNDEAAADTIMEIDFNEPGEIDTDDFTPEQALTRLAYKVHGEVIDIEPETTP